MTIDAYTREFKACIKVCEAVGSRIGISKPSTGMAYILAGNNYNTISISNDADDVVILQKMEPVGGCCTWSCCTLKG